MQPDSLPEDLNLLLTLDVLLRELHVTRAAQKLDLTQSAMSQRLSRLRDFFQDPLLVPQRGALVPTLRAQAMAAPLARALSELRSAVRTGAAFDPKSSTRCFVLLGNDVLEALGLPFLARTLRKEADAVQIVSERLDASFATRLAEGAADLAFAPDFMIPSSLRRRALPRDSFVVLARKAHPIAKGPLTLERYLAFEHVLVAPRGAPGGVVDHVLASLGKSRVVAFRVAHFVTAPLLLQDTDLLLTCPSSVADYACAVASLCRLAPPVDLPIDQSSMVWHERSQHDPGHVWLRGLFEQALAGDSKTAKPRKR